MYDRWAFFGMVSFCVLWLLSVAGGIAVWLSWVYVEPEYNDEGVVTRGSRCSVRARALLTVGCVMCWISTAMGHVFTSSSQPTFEFWRNHHVLLLTLLFLVDTLLFSSVVFAWQARGSGKWILWIATPTIAVVSIAGSIFLSRP